MIETKLPELEDEVRAFVKALENNTQERLLSRLAFYKRYVNAKSKTYKYGQSEIDFMKWEFDRVVHPPNIQKSEWWNDINLWFIFLSELGAKAKEAGIPKEDLPIASQLWVEFIENPCTKSWYKAHNSSIIDAYLKYPRLAEKEELSEQIFLNVVLYRLLFAQSMVEGKNYAFGRYGRLFASPKGFAVKMITRFENFYPLNYPMTEHEVNVLLGKTNNPSALGMKILDDLIIEPSFFQLYSDASEWNKQPNLMKYLVDNKPAYPDGEPKYEGEKKQVIRWLMRTRQLFSKKNK